MFPDLDAKATLSAPTRSPITIATSPCSGRKASVVDRPERTSPLGRRPGRSPDRPRRIDEQTRERIVGVALSCPEYLGLPFMQWSLPKLRDHLIKTGVVESISLGGVRQVLPGRGISVYRTKTWKQSCDPAFERKRGCLRPCRRRRKRGPAALRR
jgi:hypothetical protein